MYHSALSISLTFSLASINSVSASAILVLNSSFLVTNSASAVCISCFEVSNSAFALLSCVSVFFLVLAKVFSCLLTSDFADFILA